MNITEIITSIEDLKQTLSPPPLNATPAEKAAAIERTPFIEVALGALHTARMNLDWHQAHLAQRAAATAPATASTGTAKK